MAVERSIVFARWRHCAPQASTNTWFPGPVWVCSHDGISIGSTIFAGLTGVLHQYTQTDR